MGTGVSVVAGRDGAVAGAEHRVMIHSCYSTAVQLQRGPHFCTKTPCQKSKIAIRKDIQPMALTASQLLLEHALVRGVQCWCYGGLCPWAPQGVYSVQRRGPL